MRCALFSTISLAISFIVWVPCTIDAFAYPSSATNSNVITEKLQILKKSSIRTFTNLSALTTTNDDDGKKNSKSPIKKILKVVDDLILSRVIRVANHVPAFLSLAYFGTISMASMMMTTADGATKAATLTSVLSQSVGPTTNKAFASYFPTLITPAAPVFLVWPLIAILQSITLTVSSIFPKATDKILLTQSELSSLTLANICSTAWLIASSNASPTHLPLASFLILPFVPLFSGYSLRNDTNSNNNTTPYYNNKWVYQVFSSFTTIASILAFTVELQYGGRIPIIGKLGPEFAAIAFLGLYSTASLGVTAQNNEKKSRAKRLVNFGALTGILYRRVMVTTTSLLSASGLWSLVGSVSFWGTAGCWAWSVKELFFSSNN